MPLGIEADGLKRLLDLSLLGGDALVSEDKLQDGRVLLASVDVVLDVESADFIRGGEAFNLTVDTK